MNEEEQSGLMRQWSAVCAAVRARSEYWGDYCSGFIRPLALEENDLLLGIAEEFSADLVRDNCSDFLLEALNDVFGRKLTFSFEYGHVYPGIEEEVEPAMAEPVPAAEPEQHIPAVHHTAENCLEANTFENFVVGEENRYAFTGAMTAVEQPGKMNPLYIYGGSGMGKTHLIQAVANEIATRKPDAVIRYITCEEFLNEYVASLRSRTDFKFRDHFRNVDLLLVDDVHFLSGNKVQLQEEFFNTFNALYNAGHQIILTSDKQPSEIPGLEKRLVTRFQSGLTMQITSSTFETRLAILRQMSETNSVHFPDDVLTFLASHITSNIRPLKSAFLRLSVLAGMGDRITVETAERQLADLIDKEAEEKSSRLSPEAIQKAVAEHFGLQIRDLTGSKRPKEIAEPRMIAMYLCRKLTNITQQEIGSAFGGRSHATVIHAVKQVEDMCLKNEELKRTISTLQRHLQYD